jgi:hypothetical protein
MKAHIFTVAKSSFTVSNGYASLSAYIEDVKRYGGIWDGEKRFYPYHSIHYFVELPEEDREESK